MAGTWMNIRGTMDALPAQGTVPFSRHRCLSGSRPPPYPAEAGLAGAPWGTAATPAGTPVISPDWATKAHGKLPARPHPLPRCSKEHAKFYISLGTEVLKSISALPFFSMRQLPQVWLGSVFFYIACILISE